MLFASLMTAHFHAAELPALGVIANYKTGGEGGWDYLTVDSKRHRLFISRSSHVQVMNTETGVVVGDIPNTPGVHGVAISDRTGTGYTSNGRDNSVTVFDLKTLKVAGKIPVGKGPDAILYDPSSRRIVTCNGQSNDVTVIDPQTGAITGTIKLTGRPEYPAADGKGRVFVNIEDKNQIEEIDLVGLKSVGKISLEPGDGPSGLAIDPKNKTLFATCGNNILAVADYNLRKLVSQPKIGNGPDAAAFDPKYGLAYSSNGQDGTITVVARKSNGTYYVADTVKTKVSARTMALDPKTHRIYLAYAELAPADPNATGRQRPRLVPGSFTILVVGPK